MTTRCLSLGYFLKIGDYLLNFSLCSFTNWVINQGFWNTENLHYSLHKEPHGKDKRPQVQAVSGLALSWYTTFFFTGGITGHSNSLPSHVVLFPSLEVLSMRPYRVLDNLSQVPFSPERLHLIFFQGLFQPGLFNDSDKALSFQCNFFFENEDKTAFLKPKEQMNVKNILHKTH